jgi:hypothetical protein
MDAVSTILTPRMTLIHPAPPTCSSISSVQSSLLSFSAISTRAAAHAVTPLAIIGTKPPGSENSCFNSAQRIGHSGLIETSWPTTSLILANDLWTSPSLLSQTSRIPTFTFIGLQQLAIDNPTSGEAFGLVQRHFQISKQSQVQSQKSLVFISAEERL